MTEQQWVTVSRVVRPQGRLGEVLAELLTDFPERFSERRRLFLRATPEGAPREATLETYWLHKDRVVLKFASVDSIQAAEALRGYDVVIPQEERVALDEGSVYIGDLAGCMLYDRTTATVAGEIVDVDRESSNMPLIVVQPPGSDEQRRGSREELLIPFAKAYSPHIDLEARRMEMTLPEGLLGLNEPPTSEERQAAAAAYELEARESGRSGGENRNPPTTHRKKRR